MVCVACSYEKKKEKKKFSLKGEGRERNSELVRVFSLRFFFPARREFLNLLFFTFFFPSSRASTATFSTP